MRICVMTGASHALGMGSCTKAIWRRTREVAASHLVSPRRLQVARQSLYFRSQSYSFMWLAPFSNVCVYECVIYLAASAFILPDVSAETGYNVLQLLVN